MGKGTYIFGSREKLGNKKKIYNIYGGGLFYWEDKPILNGCCKSQSQCSHYLLISNAKHSSYLFFFIVNIHTLWWGFVTNQDQHTFYDSCLYCHGAKSTCGDTWLSFPFLLPILLSREDLVGFSYSSAAVLVAQVSHSLAVVPGCLSVSANWIGFGLELSPLPCNF